MKSESRNAQCDVLICFAVKEEASSFLQTLISKRVGVLISGMGERNAEKSLREVFQKDLPKLVLTCGFAGGLNPELSAGEIIFSADPSFPFTANLISSGAKAGAFFCAKRVAISIEEKSRLRLQTLADVVEMESAVIRRICAEQGIPSATVRVISDTANENLPLDFNQLMTVDYKINFAKLALSVAIRPWKIPALMQLQKKTKVAAENLSRVLESLPI